ncbi:hypothetical protein MKW98_000211 [Papaver atlanticum]|uniref:SRP54-type proteins GTP-binding domain-containing protein n=1 Tax=Papaver atlanticum TaxID=357466 RepID=A0AAD4SQP1_9MAGN|nr:hypothetical protein MKW98_000211 [Papaver atlanticum]
MEDALVRILTPKCSVDVLRDVHASTEQGRPYVITFVGVNGVGNSTNLAKIAYWLQLRNISVMMAACDTFKSEAVEQLQSHAHKLQIPIFEKGYEKDPAVVVKEAIREARRNGSDVVLVNTAGRMQINYLSSIRKLADLSSSPSSLVIDGILLTKFDFIDDNVGAALSMVYILGAPVLFVGCGQSYINFRKINVRTTVKTLLK